MDHLTEEEIIDLGFSKEEIELARGWHETDFDKDFFGGYLDGNEQLDYLYRARYRKVSKKDTESDLANKQVDTEEIIDGSTYLVTTKYNSEGKLHWKLIILESN